MGPSLLQDPSWSGAAKRCWWVLGKYWARWCKNSAVAAMLALGISSMIAAPQEENWDTVAAAAIAAMGFANLDIIRIPKDEAARKVAAAAIAVLVAGLLLFVKAGEDQCYVIVILAWSASIFLSSFAIQFMLVTWFPSKKWPHTS